MTRTTHTPPKETSTQASEGGRSCGFTIVELIIVIVVIAILATIGLIGYGAYLDRAGEVSIKSDLQAGASSLESARMHDNGYPNSGDDADGGRGLPKSDGTTLGYYKTATAYCLEATSHRAGVKQFHIAGKNPEKMVEGPCVMQVSVLAGAGSTGYADGSGTAAKFNQPHGLAVDAAGNVYVADAANSSIRKITPSGTTTTLAGNGSPGYADCQGAVARFRYPHSIAAASDGTLYVADRGNNRIRKISPSGYVSTLAGSGESALTDGTSGAAAFYEPSGIAVANDGTVYVTDTSNHAIRKITPGGVVTTIAGASTPGFKDGTGSSARFNHPWSIGVTNDGVLVVADSDNHSVRTITQAGVVMTLAGGGTGGFADGTGRGARFNTIHGIALDSEGNAYVADVQNERVRKVTPEGVVTTAAGDGTPGYETGDPATSQFNHPHGVAVGSTGVIYVADLDGHRICRLEPSDEL